MLPGKTMAETWSWMRYLHLTPAAKHSWPVCSVPVVGSPRSRPRCRDWRWLHKKAKSANALKCPKNAIISSTDQRVCLGNNAGTFQCLEPLVAPQHALLPPILNRSLWKCCNCLFQRVCLTVNLC